MIPFETKIGRGAACDVSQAGQYRYIAIGENLRMAPVGAASLDWDAWIVREVF